ncbi:integrase, catalytic region, zinc finger, CCHC-type containing protein [Tanacetum coccineum]|uniref:Integrase, catalytic region, zinc finger, CCHC-type containing protein n=1 Tax=Tanacetum coccineum TaxID=301880 RepID=A0ABQ5EQY2_9ASTR
MVLSLTLFDSYICDVKVKENGVNILKLIDEGPFQMGTFRETLTEGDEGVLHLGPERPRVYSDLSPEDKDRMQLNSKFVNNMLPEWGRFITAVKLNRGLRDSNYDQLYAYLKQHEAHANENKMTLDRFTQHTVDPLALMTNGRQNRGQGNNARGAGTTGYGGALNRVENANPSQARQVKCYNCNGIGHIARNCTQPKRPQNSEYFKDKMLLMQAQENGVALDEEQLLFLAGGQDNAVDEDVDEQPVQDLALNVDNVFQADDCDAFDSDVDEAPTAQTMFMANLSSADPVYDEAGPSYDSDILSEVHDHDHYQDAVCEHHEEHEMHDDVQPNYVVDSHADYTSNSNMIPYDQYVKDNAVPVVQSNVSSVTNDAYMMIYNDMCEPHAQSVSKTTRNTVVDNSLTAKLETYKEQVELYERRARFELTEREQKIDEQLRIVITDRNIKEENLKKELHSVKLQLASTINHNKSMVEEVTSLKKDFKQKENKYLEEFLDMKALKEKVAIGYKNPLCLTRTKQVQPALYNGYEIVKVFHLNVIHLQYQMEECHKLPTDQVDESIIRYNVSKPLLLGGPPGQVIIQSNFFFNKDLEYLRYGRKSGRPALSILKMKAAYYPDVGLEQMVPDQIHTSEGDRRAVRTHMRILSVVRIEVFSLYGYDYMKKIVLRRADLKEYTIAERYFKYMYPSDFEYLYLLNLQGHLDHLPPEDKKILTTVVNLWTRNLVIRQ